MKQATIKLVMQCLKDNPRMKLTEISKITGIPVSTLHDNMPNIMQQLQNKQETNTLNPVVVKAEKKKINLTHYKKFASQDEIKKLIQYANGLNDTIKLAFYFLIFTGMRVSEVCSLKINQIQGNRITFTQAKNHRIHTRIIPDMLKDMTIQYTTKYNISDGYLFTSKAFKFNYRYSNEHLLPDTLGAYISKFRKLYGLDETYYTCKNGKKLYRFSIHTIRHFFLTQLYERSCNDLILTASIIGHLKIGVTADYIQSYQKWKKEEALINQMVFI